MDAQTAIGAVTDIGSFGLIAWLVVQWNSGILNRLTSIDTRLQTLENRVNDR